MPVDNTDVIDFASIDKENNAVLTISDHLDWSDSDSHCYILQTKINSYLTSIENGALFKQYPKATGRKIIIEIIFKHPPGNEEIIFLNKVAGILTAAGYGLLYNTIASSH